MTMHEPSHIDSRWAQRLRRGEQPDAEDVREHLLAVHQRHAGFTEAIARGCRDAAGRNSYEWLAEAIDQARHRTVLDLACGSGVLAEICLQRHGDRVTLTGVDMSADELALARRRIPDPAVRLHQALAQRMDCVPDASMDVVLCHWALTLMDPIEPVLAEIRRVLRPNGTLAAIIDGEILSSPVYAAVHHVIYSAACNEYPCYGEADLGDSRVRTPEPLAALIRQTFRDAEVQVEPGLVSLTGTPRGLAQEATRFFYASFVLPMEARARVLADVQEVLSAHHGTDGQCRFDMPIHRLVAQL
ncbi:class I SAM-dependent methyltransferase [Thiorhodococcus minor]|uniref:Class I SAM-dependent methyltransferase n=1 Tax=Thiorhodococcus minor TaxID=57489 RepID=A0A6M0JYN8_9GAMM|nr:class I SAM-dependent methyltransferase [Thiorhodococcus minor]NEV62610.1 class I SAM-dependent methyltransferase [Thiorhodococcus minor]